jgi:hypothetical protein
LPEPLNFPPERTPCPLSLPRQAWLEPKALFIGQGQNALEAAVVAAAVKPPAGALHGEWKTRRAGEASPVLLVALNGSEAALCGPAGEDPPVRWLIFAKKSNGCAAPPSTSPTSMRRSPFLRSSRRRSKRRCRVFATKGCSRCTR